VGRPRGAQFGRVPNPPIKGHELLWEGRRPAGLAWGCRCGAKPEDPGGAGSAAVRRWHREHKAELRAAGVS